MPEQIIIASNLKTRVCIPIAMEKIKGEKFFSGSIKEEDAQISIRQALGEGTEQARIKNVLFYSNLKDGKTPAYVKACTIGERNLLKNEACNISNLSVSNLAASNADLVLDGQVESDLLVVRCNLQDDVTQGYKPYTVFMLLCLEATQKI